MENVSDKQTDLTYLKNIANGSNEFICQMISVFMEQTPEALNNMEKYLNAKNWRSLHVVAHKIKASFSFMGIKKLETVICQVEEYSLNETNTDKLPAMISEIKAVCIKGMQELEIEKKLFE